MSHNNNAMWGGRFTAHPDDFLQSFGASLPNDKRMWKEDIQGSKAHAKMLGKVGVISKTDADVIVTGLDEVAKDIESGNFEFNVADEDIHMAIEKALTEKIGKAGQKLHTGRSRNDQVATDNRLLTKRLSSEIQTLLIRLQEALLQKAEEHFGVVMPAYTHLQKAQPILFSHHMLAYFWMFARDVKRLDNVVDAADISPLGSAALAGTTYPLDRNMTAKELGFSDISKNSLDAVSDRDFFLDFLHACSLIQMHISRLSEEIILWSSDEFNFVTMDDTYSTGSSIMPQKKNPDFAELTRGKTGRVYGNDFALKTVMKSLPLAYNKDLQEDKELVFDSTDTVTTSISVMTGMISTMHIHKDNMRLGSHGGYMAATDLADYLVKKNLPFREAHEVVGALVLKCEKENRTLQDLTPRELSDAHDLFEEDAVNAISIDEVVSKRNTDGGTGHKKVKEQIKEAHIFLSHYKK